MIVEVENQTGHRFVPDGQWLNAGEWKSQDLTVPAKSTTRLEISGSEVNGVNGLAWWVDGASHQVYLSLAMARPRLGNHRFYCKVGLPPANLRAELGSAPKLGKGDNPNLPEAFCAWAGTAEGVRVTIPAEPPAPYFVPPRAEDYAASEAAAGGAAKGDATSDAAAADATNDATPSPDARGDKAGLLATGAQGYPQDPAASFLAQTRPRDATDGVVRGLKTVGAGVAGGVATAVAAPVLGAREGGALGFVKGMGAGFLGGAALVVGGTVGGVAQIGRGLAQMPYAHLARREEKIWNQDLGQWVDVDLCMQELEAERDKEDQETAEDAAPATASANIKETEYYELLKVSPGASPSDIKKAYYKVARECHPDKNPDDADATARFQKLSEVYQVLSDPDSRKKYDREGKAGIQESKQVQMDPGAFFNLLFGSERFVAWTGELHIAMQTDHMTKTVREEDEGFDPEVEKGSLKRRQQHREVQVAVHLREKCERFIYGRDLSGWEEQMRLEAHDLAQAQFGTELLSSLGLVYQSRADIYLANELMGRLSVAKRVASMKHNAAMAKHGYNFYTNAAGSLFRVRKVYTAASQAQKAATEAAKDAEGDEGAAAVAAAEEEQGKKVETALDNALPTFLETAWSYVVRDIDHTMKQVGRKFLQDKSVPWQIRIRRAQALQRLGQIFSEEAERSLSSGECKDRTAKGSIAKEEAKAVLQEAMFGSLKEAK